MYIISESVERGRSRQGVLDCRRYVSGGNRAHSSRLILGVFILVVFFFGRKGEEAIDAVLVRSV